MDNSKISLVNRGYHDELGVPAAGVETEEYGGEQVSGGGDLRVCRWPAAEILLSKVECSYSLFSKVFSNIFSKVVLNIWDHKNARTFAPDSKQFIVLP